MKFWIQRNVIIDPLQKQNVKFEHHYFAHGKKVTKQEYEEKLNAYQNNKRKQCG